MKKPVQIFSWMLCLMLGMSATTSMRTGCQKSSKAAVSTIASTPRSVDFLQKKLKANAPQNIQQVAARAKISVSMDGSSPQQASAQLIWQSDSALWISVRKFGIEGVRVLAQRDSVVVLNRLEKSVTVRTWEQIQREYHLPEGFGLLESLILGTAWWVPELPLQSEIKEGMHRLWGKNHRFSADYRIEEGTFRIRQMTFLEQNHAKAVTLSFDNFQKTEGTAGMSYLRRIETFDRENGNTQIEIELSDVEINASKSWRFEIPSHYRREK